MMTLRNPCSLLTTWALVPARSFTLASLGCSLLIAPTLAQPEPFFMGLGDLPGGSFRSRAFGISADGTTVVGGSSSLEGEQAFMWTRTGGMVGMGDLAGGSFDSRGFGVSADGTVVVGRGNSINGIESFRWTAQTGMIGLGDLPGGSKNNWANAVSADGLVIVGTAQTPARLEAYRRTPAAGMLGLGYLPGASFNFSRATGVSLDGMVVASPSYSACSSDSYEPARWTPGAGMQGLGGLPGGSCTGFAFGISPDGSAIAGWTIPAGTAHAFVWTAQTGMVSLGLLRPGASGHGAVSENGEVVVGDSFSSSDPAFIWDAALGLRGLKSVLETEYGLDLNGWTLREARGISADGRTIVGFGMNPQSNIEGWIAHLGDPCFADCNEDDIVNTLDFICYLNQYNKDDPRADCNGDGIVNTLDFLCFLNAYNEGCP